MGGHGVNGPTLFPRGIFLKQMVAWVGKDGSNFTHLFIHYLVLKHLDGKCLEVNDPLSSGAVHAQSLSFEKGKGRNSPKLWCWEQGVLWPGMWKIGSGYVHNWNSMPASKSEVKTISFNFYISSVMLSKFHVMDDDPPSHTVTAGHRHQWNLWPRK